MSYGTDSNHNINHYDGSYDDGEQISLLNPDEIRKAHMYQKWSKTLLSIGLCILVGFVLGLVGAISVQFGFQAAVDESVYNSKILIRGSPAFDAWLKSGDSVKHPSSSRIFTSAIMLNLTNPEQFLAGEAPIYSEVPRVVYEKQFRKFDVAQSGDNATISFKEYVNYVPDMIRSEIDPMKTLVTNINPAYLTMMLKENGEKNLYSRMISTTLQDIFKKLTNDYVSLAFQGTRGTILNQRKNAIGGTIEEFCGKWTDSAPQQDGDWKYMTLRIFEDDEPANITLALCKNLWDETKPYALNQDQTQSLKNADVWISAMNGDRIASNQIISAFEGMTIVELNTIIAWLKHFDTYVTWNWIKEKVFETRKPMTQGDLFVYEDLGYFQWGQGSGNPFTPDSSVKDLLKYPATPEFYYQAKDIYQNNSFDIPTSKRLASYFTEKNTLRFLENYEKREYSTIMKEWKLTKEQVDALAAYMYFVGDSFFVARLREFGEANKALLSTRTIHEWLVEYDDKFLELVGAKYIAEQLTILKNVHDDRKDSIVSTGALDLNKASHIILYEGTTTLPWVDEDGENITIIGSDGTQFHGGIDIGDYLRLWSPETMRTRELVYDSLVTREGIQVYRFKEAAYMWKKNATYHDYYTGQSNMTMFGTPTFIGNWRFYGSDAYWTTRVKGIKSGVESECITHLEVEPYTGLTFDRKKRYQVNMHLPEGSEWLSKFHPQIPKNATLFPIVMVEESSTITSDHASFFEQDLPRTVFLRDVLYWLMVALCLGCFLVGGSITLTAFALKNRALGKLAK